jgi:hypothetical protein
MSQFEQWKIIKFYQKLGKSASKMLQMIKQAYCEEALCHSAVFKWHKCFVHGRGSVEVVFFPLNWTSILQPLDQGIIRSIRHYYNEQLVRKLFP